MIDVDAGGTDARARRRTWMLGGGLLAASALLSLWVASSPGAPVGIVPGLFFAAGAIVFAIGLGQSGSVTARRPIRWPTWSTGARGSDWRAWWS
jgi:hypothetical protein